MIDFTRGAVGQFTADIWKSKITDVGKDVGVDVKFYFSHSNWGFIENTHVFDITLKGDAEGIEFMKRFIDRCPGC